MPNSILWFSQIDKNDTNSVGGKAANLGELTRAGLPVPNGFTVTAGAYFNFIEASNLKEKIKFLLEKVDINNSNLLNETSSLIKKSIEASKLPDSLAKEIIISYKKLSKDSSALVAVRSSATAEDLPQASFAGQQSTFLNIKGDQQLLDAIKKCWASLFEARAIFYRVQNDFDHFKVGIAVPVQKMVQSEVSGVMFTIDPTNNDKRKIVIEAVYGLGETIVQGKVNPDHYEVDKQTFKIVKKELGDQTKQLVKIGTKTREIPVSKAYRKKQKLNDNKIIELAKLGKKIENHYLFPQDIEWALENDKLYIVQTRPVTTIKLIEKTSKEHIEIELPKILSGLAASPGIAVGSVKILRSAKEIGKIKQGDILVATMTNPDYVPAMKKAVAIVTDRGGRTSHAAIVSREMGIPAVVGAEGATKKLRNGAVITVSGTSGIIYKGALAPAKMKVLLYEQKKDTVETRELKTATKIFVNLAEPELAEAVSEKKVDGVGLLRAEFMIAEIGIHPKKLIKDGKQKIFVNKLTDGLLKFCASFNPRPVIYRATDFKTNEYRNLKGGSDFEPEEANPLLGFRGACRYTADFEVFELELASVKRVRNEFNFRNLWLMIPFVRTLSEMEKIKQMVSAAGLHRSPSFKLLMMAEIPSNVFLINEFLDIGVDGVSIGSNDLTMLILGVDRDNARVECDFNELDPAVLKALETIVRTCRKRGALVSICGQAPSVYPELTEKLVSWGISSVSVSPDAIEKTRSIVYEAEKNLAKNQRE
ncbi:MAG: phosphoenolpyruvate synthase [Candidatus Woykebacteria bacterium RIFCSPHIGHO2_01_FULL_39_12]|uniref:Phosphoenolpyruvate synthase n=1 Tax=Candidatus Woykebacteria bacterium RIFCSPHIGHO2_01_FULL_39_12 TaxID=1802599 RepID=A0A1G1WJ49_9BACT|nr:MAG: phosphoenolpyruvate synthase [Candidatus Woykebacteria bacterium RIFCSPHIGHO2_01_FULL_39_12]